MSETLAERALRDTGVMAREVLGYDYDKCEETGAITRPGGVRDSGPHKQMVTFLDSPSRYKHIEFPRGGFKTTGIQSFCIKEVTKNPNIRVAYGMETYSMALESLDAMKEHFEENEKFIETFGDLKTKKWARSRWAIKGRTIQGMKEPTFSAFGVDKKITGGHYDIIVADDLVGWQNVRTPEGIGKVFACFKMLQPLLSPGGKFIVPGTRYSDDDLYGYILGELNELFEILIIDCGMTVEKDSETQQVYLAGEPLFPHLPAEFLRNQLATMGSVDFTSQYCNTCLATGTAIFSRANFNAAHWEPWMSHMNAWVLTDTATSEKEEGCHSVVALVAFDADNRAYLCDLRVGHMTPYEFVDHFFDLIETWGSKLTIKGQVMESICMNQVFKTIIHAEARKRQVEVNVIEVKRSAALGSKRQRIMRLHGRFERGDFVVLNTVPKAFHDLGRIHELFDPDGVPGVEGGPRMPSGELVNQFVRFPAYSKNDIADALADMDSFDRHGERICKGMSVQQKRKLDAKRFNTASGQIVPFLMTRNGVQEMVNLVPTSSGHSGRDSGAFWKRTAGRARA